MIQWTIFISDYNNLFWLIPICFLCGIIGTVIYRKRKKGKRDAQQAVEANINASYLTTEEDLQRNRPEMDMPPEIADADPTSNNEQIMDTPYFIEATLSYSSDNNDGPPTYEEAMDYSEKAPPSYDTVAYEHKADKY